MEWKICTELLQDEQPRLEIHGGGKDSSVQGYGLRIEELNRVIEEQYQRKQVSRYGVESKERQEEIDRNRRLEVKQQAEILRELENDFLISL